MARTARKRSDSGMYHIILRGINRQNIFEDGEDRYKFLEIIRYFKDQSNYELYSYCLMDNHIHILMKEVGDSISLIIKRISSTYVQWYNNKYDRIGHLFQERFKSEPVEDEKYFLTVLRYIHQNPIKAGININPMDPKWTSYYEYISEPTFINTDFGLKILSPNRDKAINLFKEYMEQENDDNCIDVDENVKLSDEGVRNYIKSLGVPDINTLQQMDKNDRGEIIRSIKALKGVSIRQLARITGISKSVIGRIWWDS